MKHDADGSHADGHHHAGVEIVEAQADGHHHAGVQFVEGHADDHHHVGVEIVEAQADGHHHAGVEIVEAQADGHHHAGVQFVEGHADGRKSADITRPTAQPQHAALWHLERFVAGIDDPASADWLRRGFLAYLRAAGAVPLTRCLRLPATAKATARMLRDRALVDAAQRLPLPQAASVWQRAQALHALIGQSHVTRSRAHRTGKLPWHGGAAVVALVQAERVAGALPTTARRLLTILQASEAEGRSAFTEADAA